jgi:hypothetical protein
MRAHGFLSGNVRVAVLKLFSKAGIERSATMDNKIICGSTGFAGDQGQETRGPQRGLTIKGDDECDRVTQPHSRISIS